MTSEDSVCTAVRETLETLSRRGSTAYFPQFFSLDPQKVALVDGGQLTAALPARRAMFAAMGVRGLTLDTCEVTVLDEDHVLARTRWIAELDPPGGAPLVLASSYLLRRDVGEWKVLVYLNHQDLADIAASRTSSGASVD